MIPRGAFCVRSLTLILLLAAPLAAAKPGDLDPTFGTAGIVATPIGAAFSGASAVFLQPDGKLVAVGTSGTPANIALVRYNPDGSLDSTFGVGGIVVTAVGSEGTTFSAAVLQPDGKILVAGQTLQTSPQGVNGPLVLLRYLPNGSLDGDDFGATGIVIYPASNGLVDQYFDTYSIVLEPDGKPVVSGASSFGEHGSKLGVLVRFTTQGSLDLSFGSSGVQFTDPAGSGVAAVQPDGKLLVAGQICETCASKYVVVRYDTSGDVDLTFGAHGVAHVTISAPPEFPGFSNNEVNEIVVQPDGKLLLASRGTLPGGPHVLLQDLLVVTRLSSTGSVDRKFAGGNGVVMAIGDPLPLPGTADPFAGVTTRIGVQSDGKVILVGQPWDNITAAFHFGAARYNADGTLDTAFGNSGIVIGPEGKFASTLVQPDDKLVIAGSNNGFTLARFLPDTGTTTLLSTSLNPSPLGQSVTLTATVIGEVPTGTVQVRDGAVAVLGCVAAPLNVGAQTSVAECATTALNVGAHVLNAVYSGGPGNAAGISPMLIQVVVSTPGTDTAIEYEYPPWNYFFVTSDPNEIAALDSGSIPGWQRTGEAYAVYPSGAPLSVTQCRFFSGLSFSPRSSHFYTPFPFECNFIRQTESAIWTFEGNVMPVQLPDALGNCAAGSRPLYRLFNNGQGGAPNHRYTTSVATRSSMISQGWIPEGAGPNAVIACVPGN